MRRLSLRAKLTLLVTVTFGLVLAAASTVSLNALEDELTTDTRLRAEALLEDYLGSNGGVLSGAATVDPAEATRFFYLDESGNQLTEDQFFDDLFASDILDVDEIDPDGSEALLVDPDTTKLTGDEGDSVIMLEPDPASFGTPHPVNLGDNVVAVAQTVVFPNGTEAEIGVSSPLRPVTGTINTVRLALLLAIPVLCAAIAAITWMTTTRALKPVHDLTKQTQEITASNLGDRLPVHASKDEIHELTVTMNTMLNRLEQSQNQQHQLISDASHELRSPVAASRAQLEVAQSNPDQTDWPSTAAIVLTEQQRLTDLIEDLLALSRLQEAGTGTLTDIDLDDLVATEANRPHPTPITADRLEPTRITGNPALLTRAIRNLIDNATRHATTNVNITLHRNGNQAVLTIDDDGPGIPPAQRHTIFERFTRLDQSRDRHTGGTGLGLAIAQEVAQAHHGHIEATTGPQGGARLTLRLPTK